MPSKIRDSSAERRREKKESRGDRSEKRDRDKDRKHKSSHTHRKSSTKEKSSSRTSISSSESRRRSSMPGLVVEEPPLVTEPRAARPYPSFSKEHSKEAVGSHPALNIFTPPATDLNASKEKIASLNRGAPNGPPSPPLTDKNAGRVKINNAKSATVETIVEEEHKDRNGKVGETLRPKNSVTNGHVRSTSEVGCANAAVKSSRSNTTTPLKNITNKATQRSVSQPIANTSPPGTETATEVATNLSSDATSIAPQQPNIQRPGSKAPASAKRAVQSDVFLVSGTPDSRQATPLEVFVEDSSVTNTPASQGPPPPPPPPNVPILIPKVDYLLQHGGLHQDIPKNLLYAGKPMAVQQATISPGQPPAVVTNLFEPYNHLLDEFQKVMSKNGSLAVATGYRSVARRLLDRLEKVFARDISSEYCTCSMCDYENEQSGDIRGVNWGEILELVSGRRDLPSWPPFAFVASPQGLGITLEMQTPMQKLDVDVPEEYREHYIRQSRKTKQSVDKWLSRQGNDPSSPPEEVDDETLTFAILTHLPSNQRPIFKDLLGIVDKPIEPPRRAPSPEHDQAPEPAVTPQPKPRPEHIIIAGQAIQRLYRLSSPPRDAETAIYLVNNPDMHNPLATLAAVSSDEWDILISGRFDGFLRSGAEDVPDPTPANGRYTPGYQQASSRGGTPAYHSAARSRNNSIPSRPDTAPVSGQRYDSSAKYGAPVAFDEETEIATLAEIERDIYVGMEALEDAFEQLHLKAEAVRKSIRERSAGLAAAAQRRRSAAIEVRMGTPASMNGENFLGGTYRWETETDDGLGDDVSELAPDDSASNISSSRRRRRGGTKRRHERMKTPVIPIDEADEYEAEGEVDDFAESEGTSSPRKR